MDLRYSEDAEKYRAHITSLLGSTLPEGWHGLGALDPGERGTFLREWRNVLLEHRLLAPHWPTEHGGGGLSNSERAVLNEEFTKAGVPLMLTDNDASGFQLLGNIVLALGTPEQKSHFLPRVISGEHLWCQGFSEPGAGSDLASVATRAVREGDEWVINGQKIWTSAGHLANWMFALVRTDTEAPKHRGLTFLLIPMDQPGIEVRPISQINGNPEFNEVFFTDARTSAENVIGEVNGGWGVAMMTLGFERGENATAMALRFQAEFDRLVDLVNSRGRGDDPQVRARLARCYTRLQVVRLLAMRSLTTFLSGEPPGPEAAIVKLYWSEYWQSVSALAVDVLGAEAIAPTVQRPPSADGPDLHGAPNDSGSWVGTYLNAFASTIYTGTSEIQRNIIAERVLGLPK
ncbi:acyl-CoA dehydrogenase family protein [Aeromicrobium chenweiae]|uniref:Acyl-CoA dehydrogenase n=1 Tax=Aeromicrobium chenweiae TaxID=2079793 RepID=A0A2S0WI02_9ACTN|nr:acyl-CoA dehydrogenase family protein [Aeromicrobium chenweiae]AWB90953.1 acyl-CoA dehydrogenase [Aeromicrobium chenweiae]TGN32173.1 acyl-CoA dehydrogenase [Aeromicrobium chenweiae]